MKSAQYTETILHVQFLTDITCEVLVQYLRNTDSISARLNLNLRLRPSPNYYTLYSIYMVQLLCGDRISQQ